MKLFLTLLSCISLGLSCFSQDDPNVDVDENIYDDIRPKHSFTLELGLPVGTGNKPFQSMMQGMAKAAPYYQFTFKNHLSLGIGANYSLFKANEFRVPEKVTGFAHSFGGFAKVGYEKFHSMRFGTDFGVKLGYTNALYVTDKNRELNGGPKSIQSLYIEPTAGFVLTAGEFISYRFVVGYSFEGYSFHTSDLGISSVGGYKPKDFKGPTQYMTFGFGFTYYFIQY